MKTIVFYEDEVFFMQDYFNIFKEAGYKVVVFGSAEKLLLFMEENYNEILLFIIDIMVFGYGNNFNNKNTDDGLTSGIALLDEIEKYEKSDMVLSKKKKIILTNRKGVIFDRLCKDIRVAGLAFNKTDITPDKLLEIVNAIKLNKIL